jgi:hypothetical protein
MQDHRLRQPGDRDYLFEIGTATWVFAILEWNAAWCCERLEPDCLPAVAERTAGGVAKKLLQLAEALPVSRNKDALIADAKRFKDLTLTRNGIMHGRPCTHEGKARLSDGEIWTLDRLRNTADEFSQCSSRLNGHLHGWLAKRS